MDFYFTEAYFGLSKNIEKMIKTLEDIESILRKDIYATITNSPENIELEAAIKEQFGFRTVAVCWTRWDEANGGAACTPIPVSNIICHTKGLIPNVVPNKVGYYDAKHTNGLVIMLSPALFARSHLSAREVCGIMLHEIGHNFDTSAYVCIPFIAKVSMSVYAILQNSLQINKAIDQLIISNREKYRMRAQLAKDTIKSIGMTTINTGVQHGTLSQGIYSGTHQLVEAIREKCPFLVKIEETFTKINSLYTMVFGKIFGVIRRVRMLTVMGLPNALLYSPIQHLISVGTRKKRDFCRLFCNGIWAWSRTCYCTHKT